MKQQLNIFWSALLFYTRLPCPRHLDHSDDLLNKATRYFPFIGWIVGSLSFGVYAVAQWLFPQEIAIAASLLAGILITGAFHEDGLADFFDGFGGGWTKEKILDIMKDSRVGTFGLVATIFSLLIKFFALDFLIPKLQSVSWWWVFLLFITYHAIARWTAIQLSFVLPYVQDDAKSKSKPIAKKAGLTEIFGVYLFATIPFLLWISYSPLTQLSMAPLALLIFYFKGYLNKWLGGFTGDCLGAVEQMAELVFLLSFVALWKFI